MVLVFDWITIILSTIIFVNPVGKIKKTVGYIIYYVFWIYYVLPLYLDCLVSPMQYYQRSNIKFAIYQNDATTRIIYDIVLLIIQVTIVLTCRKYERLDNYWFENLEPIIIEKGNLRNMLSLGMISAIVTTILLPMDNRILFYFQWRESYVPRSSTGLYFSIEKLSYIAVTCALILIFSEIKEASGRKFFTISIYSLCLFMSICAEGKRSITFYTIIVFCILYVYDYIATKRAEENGEGLRINFVKAFSVIIISLVAIAIIYVMSVYVNIKRGIDFSTASNIYTSLRIELFRDDRVRMAIYSLIYPSKLKIIDYPFQTLFTGFLNIFPLDIVFGKLGVALYEYTDYISVSLGGWNIDDIGVMMTPTILAEFISNLHIFGIIAFILMTKWFIHRIEINRYPYNIFLVLCYLLIQIYSTVYMMYFIQFTFTIMLIDKYAKRDVLLTINGKEV